MTEENTTLQVPPLLSPAFQGDILEYYRPPKSRSQLGLQLELGYGHKLYYKEYEGDSF